MGAPIIFRQITMLLIISCLISLEIIKFYNIDKKEWEITPGGKKLPHGGKVYLQPDPDLHDVYKITTVPVPDTNGMRQEPHRTKLYQKGLLTDERAGFKCLLLKRIRRP